MSLPENLGRLSSALTSDASLNIGVGVTPSGSFKLEVGTTSKFTGVATFGSTLSNGTYSYTLPGATGTLALVGGAGVGTVTSVAAITLGTTGTDLSSTVANGTTTPVITLQVPTASAANRGALSSADWSTFNGKQGTITLTTTGTSGAATLSSNTLNIPNYGSALSSYLPLAGGTLTGALSGTSATFSGDLSLTSAATGGVIITNNSNAHINLFRSISPTANFGININGNGDLNIDETGVATRLTITKTTGAATFSSSVSVGGADQGYQLDVKRTSTGDSTFDTIANFYKASTHNTGLLLRLKNTIVDLAANNITGGGGPSAGMSFSVSSGGTISTALTIASTGAATFINGAAKLFEIASNTATGGYTRFTYNTSTSIGYIGSSSQLSGSGIVSDLELRADNNLFLTTTGGSLKLASTGAATFSSSVTATQYNIANVGGKISGEGGATNYLGFYKDDGTAIFRVVSNGSGAATFSSSVLTGGNITITKTTAGLILDGNSGGGNSGAFINLQGWANTNKNWQLGVANIGGSGLLLQTSTAAGGNSFTTSIGGFDQTTGVYTALSDINRKKDFEKSEIGLDAILSLKPTLYRIKEEDETADKHLGFIAQEVKEFIPQAYNQSGDFIGLDYNPIVAALVKAIQELKAEIDLQQTQIQELKALIK